MNWVGGSRNRFMTKNDAKKQKEFFEKRKMQQKLKNLGIPVSSSPQSSRSGSMDLVTLFIVNQIASKKEVKDPPKVALFGDFKEGSKPTRNGPLVLPMSPCSPSRLSLVESQPDYSVQGVRKRKHCIPQGFRCQQLSPVLESAFSDNSASDYLPPVSDPLSPFSSTLSASSGQGIFPLQPNLQQRDQTQAQPPSPFSPAPWDTSGPEKDKFHPFSQPRSMRDCTPWSSGSNTPLYQLETPTAARVLFGSPELDNTEMREHGGHEVMFSLDPSEDSEPMLDFTLNQSEAEEEQFEQKVFRGFSNEQYGSEDSQFWKEKPKIYLSEEAPITTSRAQNATNSQCRGPEADSLTQLSDCSDMDTSYSGNNNGPLDGCKFLPSYSSGGGYLSSDTNTHDDEDRCQQCLHAGSSYVDQSCSAEIPNPHQGDPEEEHSQTRALTSQTKPKVNFRDNQRIIENMTSPDEAYGGSLSESKVSAIYKCKTASPETRDAGTQTAEAPARQTSDASTQCSLLPDRKTRAPEFSLFTPPVDVSVQNPATGRQAGCRDAATEQTASPDGCRRGGEHPPCGKATKRFRAGHLLVSSIVNKYTHCKTDSRATKQKLTNCFIDALDMTDGQEMSKQDGGGRAETGKQDLVQNGPLIKDLGEEEREEVSSAELPDSEKKLKHCKK